jgi:hypothetical protein
MGILLSITQHHFRASAEEDPAVSNIAASKSTAEPPAFDLTFDKGWISFHHDRYRRIGEFLGGDVAMVVSTTRPLPDANRYRAYLPTRVLSRIGSERPWRENVKRFRRMPSQTVQLTY